MLNFNYTTVKMTTENEQLQLMSLLSSVLSGIVTDLENKDIESLKDKLEDDSFDPRAINLQIALPDRFRELGYESLSEVFVAICGEE